LQAQDKAVSFIALECFGGLAMTSIRTLAFAGLTVIASVGAAAAAQQGPVQASQFSSLYQVQAPIAVVNDVGIYDHSGTRGRLDLGASPFYPEGPGNVSD
jgi:hypothetical protein